MHDDDEIRDSKYWVGQLTQAATDGSWFSSLRSKNYDTRMSLWDGQSSDGKKWASNYGRKVFPWEGGADCRIRLADLICNRDAQLCLTATYATRGEQRCAGPHGSGVGLEVDAFYPLRR
jgi:hypothetical protein